MKRNIKVFLLLITMILLTGCSGKLYTYKDVVNKTRNKIASDLVIEDPGSINRDNVLKAYTAYLGRDKSKKITIINGKDYTLPVAGNYLCTDFAEVYLVPKFNEFKYKNSVYNMKVEAVSNELHPRCKNLKITIDCNDSEKYLNNIYSFKKYLNESGMYLNELGVNRYDIYCQDGQRYHKN